jgi:hypothetical protein
MFAKLQNTKIYRRRGKRENNRLEDKEKNQIRMQTHKLKHRKKKMY